MSRSSRMRRRRLARSGAVAARARWARLRPSAFYPTKNLSAYGDAGIVTTTYPQMAEHMRRLRNHGSPRRYYHDEFGWNGRMDAIQAAVLRVKLAASRGLESQPSAACCDLRSAVCGCRRTDLNVERSARAQRSGALTGAKSAGEARISSIRDSRAAARRAAAISGGTQDWLGNLLSAAAASAACVLLSRIEGGSSAGRRAGCARSPGAAHVRGVDRG